MAFNFWKWSLTPASNATADPTINWRERQAPRTVNDSARVMMSALAAYRDDISGSLLTGGSTGAYTLTTNQGWDALTDGMTVAFRAHATNIAAPTLNVDGRGAKQIRSALGTALGAGVLIEGSVYVVSYYAPDSRWLLHGFFGNPYATAIGGFMDYVSSTPPNSNFVLPYGQAISRATYAALFALCGTTFGSGDGSTTFNIPDLRGRTIVGLDNMGGSAANRVTSAGSGVDGATVGAVGGGESVTLLQTNLPNIAPAFTGTAVPDHFHYIANSDQGNAGTSWLGGNNSANYRATQSDGTFNYTITGTATLPSAGKSSPGGGHTPAGTISSINGNVTQTAIKNMPPAIILPKLLRVI